MGSLMGSTTKPEVSSPTVGMDTQKNFFTALFGMGLTPNPDGSGMMFNSMPVYGGQMTPDLSKMMASNVWNSWSPQGPGMGETQQALGGINSQIGKPNQDMWNMMNGWIGPGNEQMNHFMAGQAPSALQQYMDGQGQQASFPLPQQVQASMGARPGLAQILGAKDPQPGKQRGQG